MIEHEQYMRRALCLAQEAANKGDVPVGAVLVIDNQIITESYNQRELNHSALQHAEMLVLEQASQILGRWRLIDAIVYSTLEPCVMCAGALMHARIKSLIYGAKDPKFGAIDSLYQIGRDSRLNHRFDSQNGVLAEESSDLLKLFFRQRRLKTPLMPSQTNHMDPGV